jgi:hypothetical protein
MGIGLLAIVTSVLKLYLLYFFWFHVDKAADNYSYVKFLIPTWIELFITIIGATVPCLNSLLISWMRRYGMMPKQENGVWGLHGRINLEDVAVMPSTDKSTLGYGEEFQKGEMGWSKGKRAPSDSETTVNGDDCRSQST